MHPANRFFSRNWRESRSSCFPTMTAMSLPAPAEAKKTGHRNGGADRKCPQICPESRVADTFIELRSLRRYEQSGDGNTGSAFTECGTLQHR